MSWLFGQVWLWYLAAFLVGLLLGLGISFAVTGILKSLLVQVTTTDPATFIGVSLILSGAAALGCFLPARRAMKVDPVVALRYE